MSEIIDNSQWFSTTGVTDTYTSPAYNLSQIDNLAVAVTLTTANAGTGTLTLSASVDNVNYATVPGSSTAISASGTIIYTILQPGYKWLKVVYVSSANTMALSAIVSTRNDTLVSH